MEEEVIALVVKLQEIVRKQTKGYYPDVNSTVKSLLDYVQDATATKRVLDNKLTDLEDMLAKKSEKKKLCTDHIQKIRQAMRVQGKTTPKGAKSTEEKMLKFPFLENQSDCLTGRELMDSEENATTCSVCQEIYSDPRSLPCGHSFCLKCLKGVAGNNQTFPCPNCRSYVDLGCTDVDQLPKNYVLCNVIEAREKKQPSMCLDHNKSLDLFCQRCDVVICSKCLTMNHIGHAIEDIDKIYIERNKQLRAFLESTTRLTSMTQEKSDAVKQSRISMKTNIDSISETVENTFKKWNDALQKQHNAIFSYLHQERDQKRQVCVDAERVLAGFMTTVTGLETDINKLRSKDAVSVVQQYGSIKARLEDTKRQILQEIETCFTPPDTLVLEVYAPWIEEAINNIKHIDMKHTQAKPGRQKIAEIQEENVMLMRECEKLRITLQEPEKRLSELASAKLAHDNPAITDLSDPHRPTKLAEKYSSLYDNQWTDAFAELTKLNPKASEKVLTEQLLNILTDGFNFCKEARQDQVTKLEQLMLDPAQSTKSSQGNSKQVNEIFTKHLIDAAKESSIVASENIFKAFVSNTKKNKKYEKWMESCDAYIEECVRLCWLMQVQSRPVCIDLGIKEGQPFVKDTYREYTSSGKQIAFVVWPALFLHEKGPLLMKGVAQGK